MRRFAVLLVAGVPALLAGQGFGIYEHNTCAMGRAGVAAASPCADGSAIFFSPAGLAGLSGIHLSGGVTLIQTKGGFTDDLLRQRTDLDNPVIPVPNGFLTYAASPKVTVGVGVYAPYGLETRWPTAGFEGRFFGYDTKVRSMYVQPTVGYQVNDWLKVGLGVAYIHSTVELHQRVDLSTQSVPGQPFTFAALGIPTGTDFADGALNASGNGVAVNFGAIIKVNDRLSIGGHFITRKTIDYSGSVAFTQVMTNLILPPSNPVTGSTTPVDLLVAAEFAGTGALTNGPATTSITLPDQGSIGFAYKLRDNWTAMADYQQVVWGWFNSLTIAFANPATPTISLSPRNKDTHGFRFGTEYQYNAGVTLRAGYLVHSSALPSDFVTPLLPESVRSELTAGAGFTLGGNLRGDVAYQYIKQNDRRGQVFPTSTVGNTGLYTFHAHLFGFGLAYTF
jgi:long-chain fatty acid transport protein